ncbi:amidohydrolase family protein [Microbacterium enclense]|uniref:metal-dependent hydrolase family protein n=1 Tax=Microbacterium enclense TaxID=993073 RepID=UPI0021A3D293|nr:amidohydrolase family protein [Microbacterium enclense]MCT2085154.1 amidohydrolase family protein [Microbacterium enclense]
MTRVAPADLTEDGDQVIDLAGGLVMPGFIDAHCHLGLLDLDDRSSLSPAEQAAHIFGNLSVALDEGFTTVRDVGGIDGSFERARRAGLIRAPRVLASGAILSQIGGHGDLRRPFDDMPVNEREGLSLPHRLCTGAAEVTRAAREQFRRGATQLKMHVTGGVLSAGDELEDPQFALDEIAAAVAVARDRGSYVTAHAHTMAGLRRALEAGVRCFEHGSFIAAEDAELLRSTGASVVPTMTIVDRILNDELSGAPADWLERESEVDQAQRAAISHLASAGVPVGSGSDLVGVGQRGRATEIALKAEVLGVFGAIESATRVNAEICGLPDSGVIRPGAVADLIVHRADVLDTPSLFATRAPHIVVQSGRVVVHGEG